MIDSHCHLDSDQFDQDREQAIERALAAGVRSFLAIGTGHGPPDLEAALRMCALHPAFFATVGVHPHNAAQTQEETYARLRELAQHPKVLAIGEIGLDYHYDFSPRDVQREVFIRHLEIARELSLPIVIHTREAWADTLALLREHWNAALGGVFHCFTGTVEEAAEAVSMNFHLGFGGVTTFPKAEALREAATFVPLNRLLVETDAPYLAPVPHRGQRNEPAYVMATAQRLASLRGLSLAELDEQTTANFLHLFPKAKSDTLEQLP